jgi:hypothetical protein
MRQKSKYPGPVRQQPVATCPACGKRAFVSKRSAKLGARLSFPGKRMRFYKCPGPGVTWWHMTSQDARRTAVMRAQGSPPAQSLEGYLAWLEGIPLDQIPGGEDPR